MRKQTAMDGGEEERRTKRVTQAKNKRKWKENGDTEKKNTLLHRRRTARKKKGTGETEVNVRHGVGTERKNMV